jgi:hypothetical protein
MEAHEEMANIFLWMVGALGLFSLVTFYADFKSKKIASTLYALTFVAALGTMVFAQRVGTSGGEIRHTEIRSAAFASIGVRAVEIRSGAAANREFRRDRLTRTRDTADVRILVGLECGVR